MILYVICFKLLNFDIVVNQQDLNRKHIQASKFWRSRRNFCFTSVLMIKILDYFCDEGTSALQLTNFSRNNQLRNEHENG